MTTFAAVTRYHLLRWLADIGLALTSWACRRQAGVPGVEA